MVNRYRIEHKIATLSVLHQPFKFRGFTLSPWRREGAAANCGGAWCAAKEVEAANVYDAVSKFRDELTQVVDRIAFVSQCFAVSENESFLVMKVNDNQARNFFLYFTEERSGAPLFFLEKEIAAIRALEAYQEKGDAFHYLREATNATTFDTRLAMLMSALEALAGEIVDKNCKRTRKDYIKNNILNNDHLYGRLFKYGVGVRNKLLHGRKVEDFELLHEEKYVSQEIYKAIISYFASKHSVELETEIVNPQRIPVGNYRYFKLWLRYKQGIGDCDLRSIHEKFSQRNASNEGDSGRFFGELFDMLDRSPEGY